MAISWVSTRRAISRHLSLLRATYELFNPIVFIWFDYPINLVNNSVPGTSVKPSVIINEKIEPQEDVPSLFNFLPQPKNKKPQVIEEDDEFLHKKEVVNSVKPKAKITVPSLSDVSTYFDHFKSFLLVVF